MNQNSSREDPSASQTDTLIDYVVHHYGLTRDEARDLVKQFGGNKAEIDAAAGWVKALKRE
jgi:hypothetical protein